MWFNIKPNEVGCQKCRLFVSTRPNEGKKITFFFVVKKDKCQKCRLFVSTAI